MTAKKTDTPKKRLVKRGRPPAEVQLETKMVRAHLDTARKIVLLSQYRDETVADTLEGMIGRAVSAEFDRLLPHLRKLAEHSEAVRQELAAVEAAVQHRKDYEEAKANG